MDLDYYMSLPYKIEIIKDADEEGYVAFIPELKGCITTGITEEDTLGNLNDAKAAWLSSALEDGDPIPEPDVNATSMVDNTGLDKAELWKSLLGSIPGGDAVDVKAVKAVRDERIGR